MTRSAVAQSSFPSSTCLVHACRCLLNNCQCVDNCQLYDVRQHSGNTDRSSMKSKSWAFSFSNICQRSLTSIHIKTVTAKLQWLKERSDFKCFITCIEVNLNRMLCIHVIKTPPAFCLTIPGHPPLGFTKNYQLSFNYNTLLQLLTSVLTLVFHVVKDRITQCYSFNVGWFFFPFFFLLHAFNWWRHELLLHPSSLLKWLVLTKKY